MPKKVSKKINRLDLADSIVSLGVRRASAAAIVEVFLAKIKEELLEGNTIELRGFCTLTVQPRKARKIRKVNSLEETQAAGGNYLKVKTHHSFRNALEGSS